MAVSKALAKALRWTQEEIDELADEFLDHKTFVWVETITDLLREHGADVSEDDVDVSDDILAALRAEAREHAGFVVESFNRDLERFLQRNADTPRAQLLGDYEAWANDRASARAEMVAITEAYSAHADATLAFYQAQGVEPDYDFDHSHAGEDAPSCEICEALEANNPHPHARVIEVGVPHPQCRQSWKPREPDLPDDLRVPILTSGIVGSTPLIMRHGNDPVVAAATITALAEPEPAAEP